VRAGWGVWRERVYVQRCDTNDAARADRLLVRRNKHVQVCTKQEKGHEQERPLKKKKLELAHFFFPTGSANRR
jgi:hypothetical protein